MSMIFFFKQKTAYEMRISDWSSDVCSSDLLGVARTIGPFVEHQVALVQPDLINLELECQFRHEIPAQSERQAVLAIAKRLLRHSRGGVERCQLGHEIGRASCRERVCQYV